MSRNILRYEWQWNETLNPTPFHLGRPVQQVLPLLTKVKDEAGVCEYEAVDGNPWSVCTHADLISAVFFRTTFFELLAADLWDQPAAAFVAEVDRHLARYPATGGGDRLQVVFRIGFVAIAGFSRP